MTTRFEKDSYTGLETCKALWDINNENWEIPILRIKIGIIQSVVLTAYSGVYRRQIKVGERFYDGVPARTKAMGQYGRYLEIPLYELKNNVNRNNFKEFGILDEDALLAQTLQPTTTGLSVNITYNLQVDLDYDTYWADMPRWTTPMFIQAPELQNFKLAQAPSDWNPQVFDEVNLALPVHASELIPYQYNQIPSEKHRLLEDEKYESHQNYLPSVSYSQGVPLPSNQLGVNNSYPVAQLQTSTSVTIPASQTNKPKDEWDV